MSGPPELTGPGLAKLRRREDELAVNGPVHAEELARLIWDNQSIRRAYRQLGWNNIGQHDAAFRPE